MSGQKNRMGKIKKTGEKAAHNAIPIVKIMAQFGYAARGLIYFVMGLLALLLAFENGGKTVDRTRKTVLGWVCDEEDGEEFDRLA